MDHLTLLEAVILGIVEGISEYLPISSTGHLILTAALLGLDEPVERKESLDAFLIVIQGGAILAVLGLYWKRVVQMIRGLLGRDVIGRRLAINIIVAFLPAAILGVLLHEIIEFYLFQPATVLLALALGGIVMIGIGPWQRTFFHEDPSATATPESEPTDAHTFVDLEHLTWKRALVIGLLQCIAMWPGTSRSMVTIVGGMITGMRPKDAAEFSFLLGLPTLGGACLYKIWQDMGSDGPGMLQSLGVMPVIIGMITATITAAIAVKWLVGFLSRHGVAAFGWYRLALCAVMGAMILGGMVSF